MPIPGAIFTFALANGLHGACRVIRGPSDLEAINFAGHMLVSATPWVGKTVEELRAVLKAPDTKKTLKTAMGVALYWMKDAPPPEFTAAGAIALPKGDLTKASRTTGPWSMFPNVVYGHWRKQNEPNAVAADRAASEEEGRRRQAAALEHLEKHDGIDLAGLVPLPKPKTEREPVEVLRGFIAAMNRWEAESERIFKQPDGALVTRFNRPAQELIFDEFCTPKDRKYGRLGSFSMPPEYDPEHEEILEVRPVGPRRVEIETQRRSGGKGRIQYVLLKTNGMWLIDSKTVNGNKGTL